MYDMGVGTLTKNQEVLLSGRLTQKNKLKSPKK